MFSQDWTAVETIEMEFKRLRSLLKSFGRYQLGITDGETVQVGRKKAAKGVRGGVLNSLVLIGANRWKKS